jgi:hypothetical protein
MGDVIKVNPFLKEKGIDLSKLHVTFLSEAASKSALKNLRQFPTPSDRFHIVHREIYLYCPGGYGNTKLSNTALEKALSVGATTRNWKTVNTRCWQRKRPSEPIRQRLEGAVLNFLPAPASTLDSARPLRSCSVSIQRVGLFD